MTADRSPRKLPLGGVERTRSRDLTLPRKTLALLIAIAFAAGLFTGGIAFGLVLVHAARKGAS